MSLYVLPSWLCYRVADVPPLASFPTRRSSDLASEKLKVTVAVLWARLTSVLLTETDAVGVTVSTANSELVAPVPGLPWASCQVDRKRTRLNSIHANTA